MWLFSVIRKDVRFLDDGGLMMLCFIVTLTHTATEWLLLCPLTQTFPQKKDSKPQYPLYPPQKTVAHLTCLFLPLIFAHTHTHTQIGTFVHIQTELTRSTAVHKVTNWGLCLLKGGGEPLLCTHTHRTIQFHCEQVSLHTRQCTLLPAFKKKNMVPPLWEVESFSSLTE